MVWLRKVAELKAWDGISPLLSKPLQASWYANMYAVAASTLRRGTCIANASRKELLDVGCFSERRRLRVVDSDCKPKGARVSAATSLAHDVSARSADAEQGHLAGNFLNVSEFSRGLRVTKRRNWKEVLLSA